jgi:hypothetical protein
MEQTMSDFDVIREFFDVVEHSASLYGIELPTTDPRAALSRVETEREADRQRWADTDHLLGQALTRAEAAEARVTELEAALEAVRKLTPGTHADAIARAALADKEGTT